MSIIWTCAIASAFIFLLFPNTKLGELENIIHDINVCSYAKRHKHVNEQKRWKTCSGMTKKSWYGMLHFYLSG